MKTYNNPREKESLIKVTKQEFFMKDYFSKATYIDKESGRDKRFGELPVFPLSKTIYRYLKKEAKKIIIDDDDDHGIEHLRHNRMFLDKKQGWCHTIVVVVPQEATRIVTI